MGRISCDFIPLANALFQSAPPGSTHYILRKIGCPHGNGVFKFPVPNRVTQHSDNTLRESHFYQLYPFEAPRVPWEGYYEVLFLVPSQGLVAPEDPSQQQVYVKSVVPRAAWDEQALWEFIPAIARVSLERLAPRGVMGQRGAVLTDVPALPPKVCGASALCLRRVLGLGAATNPPGAGCTNSAEPWSWTVPSK